MLVPTYFALLLVTVTVGLELHLELSNKWQQFKSIYGKKYEGNEEVRRKEIFKKNVEAILQHNLISDINDVPYTLGVNEFSDMSHEEFVIVMTGVPLPDNYTTNNEVMVPSGTLTAPSSLDWRNSNMVTSVKNQGRCGACWAFAAIGAVEGAWAKKRNELLELSQQMLVDCSTNNKYGNNGCFSGSHSQAMKFVIDMGVTLDSCYRYTEKQSGCSLKTDCRNVKISRMIDVPKGSEQALMEAVACYGPLAVGLNAENPEFQSYKNGIYCPSSCSQTMTHSVTLIGYGNENGNDYWLLKNSWGTTWGQQGIFKLARNNGNMCGIASHANYAIA